jgi:hypothetical protein
MVISDSAASGGDREAIHGVDGVLVRVVEDLSYARASESVVDDDAHRVIVDRRQLVAGCIRQQ